jgi:hypothetical protein
MGQRHRRRAVGGEPTPGKQAMTERTVVAASGLP